MFSMVASATFVGIAHSHKTFGSMTGTVTDPACAVVPNATITATNVETNIKKSARAN